MCLFSRCKKTSGQFLWDQDVVLTRQYARMRLLKISRTDFKFSHFVKKQFFKQVWKVQFTYFYYNVIMFSSCLNGVIGVRCDGQKFNREP